MFAKEVLVVKVMFWSGKAFSPEFPGLLSICNESELCLVLRISHFQKGSSPLQTLPVSPHHHWDTRRG